METDKSGKSQSKAKLAVVLRFAWANAAARDSALLLSRIMFVAQYTSPDDGVDVFGFLRVLEVVCRQEPGHGYSDIAWLDLKVCFAHCNDGSMWGLWEEEGG